AFPAAASAPLSRAASPSAPRRLERLTLSLGADLVVRVRSVADRLAAGARLLAGRSLGGTYSARRGSAPLTSTRWLERRGMLETASIPGAAAAAGMYRPSASASSGDLGRAQALALGAASGSALVSVRAVPLRAGSGAPLALWALAFLPATLALLRDSLR
ncbi:MAG: hypothetical protein HKL90_04705, partial [Elusimicrobia bacterium]|nr:hypothetical protein [Elusimicrobiota bacterium]